MAEANTSTVTRPDTSTGPDSGARGIGQQIGRDGDHVLFRPRNPLKWDFAVPTANAFRKLTGEELVLCAWRRIVDGVGRNPQFVKPSDNNARIESAAQKGESRFS